MPVPISSKELTPEWFSSVLGATVKPNTFKLKENVQDGVGFSSTITRVEFETVETDGFKSKYALIVKMSLEPVRSQIQSKVLDSDRSDLTEISTYQTLLPDLLLAFPSLQKYFCGFVYSEVQTEDNVQGIPHSSVILLEDMEAEGYGSVQFSENLRPTDLWQGLKFLAEFHTASKVLESVKRPTALDLYSWFPTWHLPNPEERISSIMHYRFCNGFQDVLEVLVQNSNKSENSSKLCSVIEAFQKLAPHADAVFKFVLNATSEKCIIHGDLWPCNLLVHSDTTKSIKVIDFQMLGYADPTYDLAPFILSSLPLECLQSETVLKNARQYYEDYLHLNKNRIGIRTQDEFLQFFKTYGLSYGLIWFVIGCRPISTSLNPIAKLTRVFTLLYEMNVLDFLEPNLSQVDIITGY